LAFCPALISGAVILFGEIYLLDNFPFKIPDSLPTLPTNLIMVLLGILFPFFIASLVHRFVFTRLTHAPR